MKKNDNTNTRTNKHIMLPAEERRLLARDFKTTEMTVSRALRFIGESGAARMIRAAALQRGGAIYDPDARKCAGIGKH